MNGPGGYSGRCLAAPDDCLRGRFGYTAPATLLRRNAATARAHLPWAPTPYGERRDRSADGVDALAEGGTHVTLA